MNYGITAIGAYIPRLRLQRSAIVEANGWANSAVKAWKSGTRTMKNWDEDSLTMAVEAARDCLSSRSHSPSQAELSDIVFASNSAVYRDRSSAAQIAQCLSLDANGLYQDLGNNPRASTLALIDNLRRGTGERLLVASDSRPGKPASLQEIIYGDAAAAVCLGSGDKVIAGLRGSANLSTDFLAHFQSADQRYELHWEERWVRDEGLNKLIPPVVAQALADAGVQAADIDHFLCALPMKRAAQGLARRMGFAESALADDLIADIGLAGATHPLLLLVAALEKAQAGEKILLCAFGGGADALVLEVLPAISDYQAGKAVSGNIADAIPEANYQKFLSFNRAVELDWGIRGESEVKTALSQHYRTGQDMAAFNAGQCEHCGTVQFPRADVCVNPACDATGPQMPLSLRDQQGEILSFTADWLSFKECPPFCFGLVQFNNGARVLMEFVDVGGRELDVGTLVRPVYRRKETDSLRHFSSYFWKAAPALPSVNEE